MILWLRLAGASVVMVAALVVLDYFGVLSLTGARSAEQADETAHRVRELFWHLIFMVVMATAVWAAARRWAVRLRRHMPSA